MSFKMQTGFCWVGTIAAAVMAFCLPMMEFTTPFHRMLIGGTSAYLVLLNGIAWSLRKPDEKVATVSRLGSQPKMTASAEFRSAPSKRCIHEID